MSCQWSVKEHFIRFAPGFSTMPDNHIKMPEANIGRGRFQISFAGMCVPTAIRFLTEHEGPKEMKQRFADMQM